MYTKIKEVPRFLYNALVDRTYPISLVHFVTNRCNARCPFCFIDFDDPKTFHNELTLNEIEKITKSLGPIIKNINLTGGEPFIRKDLVDIAKLYFKNSLIESIYITSNGSLPERVESFLNIISKEFPNRKIIFSLSIDDLPDNHNRIRRINNLFNSVIETYKIIKGFNNTNIDAKIGITVSHENYNNILRIYDLLRKTYNVDAISATLVRDEGIYKTPIVTKKKIQQSYQALTSRIKIDLIRGNLTGYKRSNIQGRLLNQKNIIANNNINKTYIDDKYISPCHASSLFGVIDAKGKVYPCEILKEKCVGDLSNYDFDFIKLWRDDQNKSVSKWIKRTKCHCTYECAWSANILGNIRYHPKLLMAALGNIY